jgi:hypothetical protein
MNEIEMMDRGSMGWSDFHISERVIKQKILIQMVDDFREVSSSTPMLMRRGAEKILLV